MTINFRFIPYADVAKLWPICRQILIPSFRDLVNTHSVDDYLAGLQRQIVQLWVAEDAGLPIGAAVTQVDEGSAMRVCTVLSISGVRFSEWAAQFDKEITSFAKQNGCHAIEAVTRRGFARVLPDLQEDGVIYVKLLGEKNE